MTHYFAHQAEQPSKLEGLMVTLFQAAIVILGGVLVLAPFAA